MSSRPDSFAVDSPSTRSSTTWRIRGITLGLTALTAGHPGLLRLVDAVAVPQAADGSQFAARAVIATALLSSAPVAGLWALLRGPQSVGQTMGEAGLRVMALFALAALPLYRLLSLGARYVGIVGVEDVAWLAVWLVAAGVAALRVDGAERR